MAVPSMATPDGRRFWSFLVILGGCFVFTTFAAVAVWLVRGHATYSLYLGLAAHVQLLVGMTVFGWVLGRRPRLKGGRDGFEIDDTGDAPAAARAVAEAADAKAEEIEEEGK